MISKRQRPNTKEVILKGVYHDNLRIIGKGVAASGFKRTGIRWVRWGGIAAMMLVLTIGASHELNSSRPVDVQHLPQAAAPSTSQALPGSIGTGDGRDGSTAAELEEENLLAQIPIWDFNPVGDPHLEDYALLLSRDDRVRLSSIFGLEVKTIVIDPGHGGHDPGAVGALGTKEKDITLDVARRLKERLSRGGHYQVLMTRESDQTLSLASRVLFAQLHKTDLFISVHVNSLPDQRVNVIETYYFGAPLNSETLRLAEQENKESGYALGEIGAIIGDIGSTIKRQESARLAVAIQTSLFRNVKFEDATVRDTGIKMAPFVVLAKVEVPSVLVEISCLTKDTEEIKLSLPDYREKIAKYMEEGIVAYLDINHAIALHGEK